MQGKGKIRGSEKKGKGKETEAARAMYIGEGSSVLFVPAYGNYEDCMPSSARATGALVNIATLKQRIGQLGLLYWDDKTKLSTLLEAAHTDSTYAFTYDVSGYSTEFATISYIQDLAAGSFVALV